MAIPMMVGTERAGGLKFICQRLSSWEKRETLAVFFFFDGCPLNFLDDGTFGSFRRRKPDSLVLKNGGEEKE